MNNTISWLNDETMRNTVYHNHKENMAWVATALYLTGAFTLGWHLKDIADSCEKTIASLAALSITGLAVWFVCWQFKKRRFASYRCRGLIQATVDLCKEDYKELDWVVQNNHLYPNFISKYISSYSEQAAKAKEDQWKSEAISLLAIGIAFIIFIILILC